MDSGKTRAERRRAEAKRGRRQGGKSGRHVPRAWWWIGGVGGTIAALVGLYFLTVASGSPSRPGAAPAGTQTFSEKDRNHVQGTVQYDHMPPAGGNHAGVWLNCGVYGQEVPNENAVHSLEHGAVWITYKPSLSPADVQALSTLVQSSYDGPDRYVILSPFPGQSAAVTATAWGNQLQLDRVSDPRLRQFIAYFRQGPQDLEQGASCSGGVGTPIG